jgi:large subunit ribosomal protein L10
MARAESATKPRERKVTIVEEIRTKLGAAAAAVLTEYRGLTVGAIAELRGVLRPADAEYKIFKNTLGRLAAEAAGLTELVPLFEGPTAIAFVQGDAVIAAKALRDFGRTHPSLVVKGGTLGPRVLTPAEWATLADIAPRDALLAQLAGAFQAPLTKAAGLFQAFPRNLAYGIKAYVDQRVAAGEALEEPVAAAAQPEAAEPAEPEAAVAEPASHAEPTGDVAEEQAVIEVATEAAEASVEAAAAAGVESPAEAATDPSE